ncbi:hypothetical protein B0H12DRAFT_1092302 [Mycena haematopus]|nr:hypothetical protein B0H12DRAFT_1092302 [Mycena haematopus]
MSPRYVVELNGEDIQRSFQTNNTFNPILASSSDIFDLFSSKHSRVDLSLSAPGPSSSSSTSPSSSSSLSTTSTSVNLPTSISPTPHKSKSNAGAIAGGVVGGLVVVVATALAVLFYLRRRNRPLDKSGHFPSNFSTSGPSILDHSSRHTAASPQSITPYHYVSR